MFFHYSQNNSGGRFSGPAINVIVEADNSNEADSIAEENGLYFDGNGDCPCCGYRWSSAWGDGAKRPEIYGEPVDENSTGPWSTKDIPYVKIIRKAYPAS